MTADTAVLLVSKLSVCGRALVNRIVSGRTLVVVRMNCAKEFLSFAHELAHSAGLMHDAVDASKVKYWFGRGHYWQGSDGNLYSSVLASKNGKKRLNRYSNPKKKHVGAKTGFEDVNDKFNRKNSNNAKFLRRNRRALALVGDESQSCPVQAQSTTGDRCLVMRL